MHTPKRLPAHLEKSSAVNVIRTVKATLVGVGLALGGAYVAYLSNEAWTAGQKGIESARVLNEGQQIQAAARLFQVDNPGRPIVLAHLVNDGYLDNLPPGWVDSSSRTHARLYRVTPEMCRRLNEKCGVCLKDEAANLHPDQLPASFGCLPALSMAFFKYE